MSKFICENSDCSEYGKEVLVARKIKFILNKSGNLEPDVFCEVCKQVMKHIPPKTEGEIRVNYASFSSKSSKEKKEILKKRADIHTKTKMRDSVQHIKSKFGIGEK